MEIQRKMSPVQGDVEMYYKAPAHARLAAVLALLTPEEDSWHITLIKRPTHPRDLHAGQISFPGGGLEKGDRSFEDCAMRETFEEIGVPPTSINIIGELTKLYVYASNNLVYPFVGYLQKPFQYTINEKEVESVISMPMTHFTRSEVVQHTTLKVRNYTLKEVPYYDLNGEVLWGATAMMISELIHLWQQ